MGVLGTYEYCATAADALPPRATNLPAVSLASPGPVRFEMPAPDSFVAYRAGYWPAADWPGEETRYAGQQLDAPQSEVSFDAPPTGDWMLAIHATFANGGNAVYYWHVTVP